VSGGDTSVGGKSCRIKTNKFALPLGEATFAERAAALQEIAAARVSFIVGANESQNLTDCIYVDLENVYDKNFEVISSISPNTMHLYLRCFFLNCS